VAVRAQDHDTDDHRCREQAYSQHTGVKCGIAQQDSQQPESSAGGTQGKIQALAGMGSVAQKDKQHRGDDGLDG